MMSKRAQMILFHTLNTIYSLIMIHGQLGLVRDKVKVLFHFENVEL